MVSGRQEKNTRRTVCGVTVIDLIKIYLGYGTGGQGAGGARRERKR